MELPLGVIRRKRRRSHALKVVRERLNGKYRFKLAGYYVDGKRVRKYFETREAAETFIEAEKIRMFAEPHLIQINTPLTGGFSLLLSNNASTGGTCFGDSGGPNYLGSGNVIAGVTSFARNGNCAGTGGVFRLDRQDVLDFVTPFLN